MNQLDIIVVGASGDLAGKKIFPALFSLYSQGYLPENFSVYGFARSGFDTGHFRSKIESNLTCRYVPEQNCETFMRDFLERCFYVQGRYDDADSYLDLYTAMSEKVGIASSTANRLFFFAVPSEVFTGASVALGRAGLVHCGSDEPWTRAVIEKPFGRDRQSSDDLVSSIGRIYSEKDTFRIDHYLGKEAIQNLMVLRFANSVFEPIWCKKYIESVDIVWKEDFGAEGRGGYFDRYGIIRDVVQNHLMQILSLLAMDMPSDSDASYVRDAKVAVLRDVRPPTLHEVVLGQYEASADGRKKGYRQDPSVPDDSVTPTFVSLTLKIDNERWRGVPFRITAGKALDVRVNEVRIRFRPPYLGLWSNSQDPESNELRIRIQPDEGLFLRLNSKVPGMNLKVAARDMDMLYRDAFSEIVPDAYERLLLDVIKGDRSFFIRKDELEAAWDIFTPLLAEIDRKKAVPVLYRYGSTGPDGG